MNRRPYQNIYHAHAKCKFKCRKCNSNQKWNNDKCRCEWEKDYIWNPATCRCKNEKYSASITDDLVIRYDEIIDTEKTKTGTTNFIEQKCNL